MGILADFFVADPDDALRYAKQNGGIDDNDEDDESEQVKDLLNPLEYKGITSIHMGTLWAILENTPWDVKRHQLGDVFFGEEYASWLFRFPDALSTLLANADAAVLENASVKWSETEEMDVDAADVKPLLNDLQSLARHAIGSGKSVYLWGCL